MKAMKRMMRLGAGLTVCMIAAAASAQPAITSLGSGTPISVTNSIGGTVYVGGSGVFSTAPARWTLTGGALSVSEIPGAVGGGYMSADGNYVTAGIVNGPTRFAIGNATTANVSPAFNAPTYAVPATLAASATLPAATEFGGARWSALTNTLTNLGVVPIIPFTPNPTPTIDIGNSGVFGPSSSGSTTSNFLTPNAISPNGRFIVGLAYVCVYNAGSTAGTSISANSFYWRPFIWDAQGNAGAGKLDILPTPFRTSTTTGANTRRRTGNPYAVSNDGLVIVGATEHNASVLPGADVDGGRLAVWRFNAGTSKYDMTYLDTGVDGSGFPQYVSSTPGTMALNAAGTIIAARGPIGITKWVWNGSSWGSPIVLGSIINPTLSIVNITCPGGVLTATTLTPHNLAVNDTVFISGNSTPDYNTWQTVTGVPSTTTFELSGALCVSDGTGGTANKAPSWLPFAVTSCSIPPTLGGNLAMSDDGNTIVGSTVYSTCGSFMSGGFIWHNSDGVIRDWYDYLLSLKPDIAANYGPIGDNGDPTKGLPKLGYPTAISPDGNALVGIQGGTQRIPGAAPTLIQLAGGASCVAPSITTNPTASMTFSRCGSAMIFNAGALGTQPITYQWYKGNGQFLGNGLSEGNGTITGADTFQMRIATPGLADAGVYYCVATGCNGLTATTTTATVTAEAALNNDSCATAANIAGEGATNFNICDCYSTPNTPACSASTELAALWFRYTPSFTGDARFQTCAATFDTTLQVLDGCGGNELACNNDVGARGLAGIGASCSSTRSVISRLHVTAGVPVLVRVGAVAFPFSSSATSGVLTISQAPAAPANDLCANATVVGTGNFPFNLSEATDDFTFGTSTCSIPVDSATASNRDVWFRLNAACGGTFSFTTCGSTISNPMLHIMSADCSGSVIMCDDNTSGCTTGGSQQAQILNLAITGPVLIRVSQSGTGSPGTAATSGTGVLNITGTPTPCPGACCQGATCTQTLSTACTGANTHFSGDNTTCNVYGVNNVSPCCFADFNGDGAVTVADIFNFLTAWFATSPTADINGVGGTTVTDIFNFLSAWFTRCS